MRLFQIIIFLCVIAVASCKKDKTGPVTPAYNPAVQTDLVDVSYGGYVRNKYNIYLPANRNANTPVLFIIHGGAWVAGSKEDIISFVPALRSLLPQYAFVFMNYRLFSEQESSNTRFPAQENDAKACIEHVLSRSDEYVISKKMALWGMSAGAHLAALYAYKYEDDPYTALAVIEQVGPTDMLSLYDQLSSPELKGLLIQLMGDPATKDSLLYNSSSPLRYVRANSCPTLILHGDADAVVPYQQAELLKNKLQQLNVPYRYKLYPGEGHGLEGVTLDAINEVVTFLNTHVK